MGMFVVPMERNIQRVNQRSRKESRLVGTFATRRPYRMIELKRYPVSMIPAATTLK
jgi:tRNA (Thr-GGU) A37 N-methylase